MEMGNARTLTMSVTSGKGGVGKTTLVSNLAYALAKMQKKVLILDADFGMSNVEIFFSAKMKGTLLDVIQGKRPIQKIISNVTQNIDLISGGNGWVELTRLNSFDRQFLLEAVASVMFQYDYLIIDTSPGISDNVLYLNSSANEVIVIINSDPSSFTDSYALIKLLYNEYKRKHFSIVVNQVKDEGDGLLLFRRFYDVTSKFLNVGLSYLGSIPQDPMIRKSNQLQRLVLQHEPYAISSHSIMNISLELHRNLSQTVQKENNFWTSFVGIA